MEESGTEPRRRRRAWPWVLGAIVLLLLLTIGAIVLVVLLALGSTSGAAQPTRWEEDYISGSGSNKIAVLPVSGTISEDESSNPISTQTSSTPGVLLSQLEQASRDNKVKAVILEVDSPGGSVVASDEMHGDILDFKHKTGKPVIVSMQDTAASGAYYISTAADKIVANRSTFTGSIGVIMELLNFSKAANKYGVTQVDITSGKFKDMGSPWKKISPQDRKVFQNLVNNSYDQFVSVVSKGRSMPQSKVRKIADGRVYSGLQAKKLGLVDQLGNLDTAVSDARSMAKIKKATVVRYTQPPGLLSSLTARLAPQPPEAVQVMQAAGLDPTPRLEYIYRPGM